MKPKISISAASNTEIPLCKMLIDKGYNVRIEHNFCIAENEHARVLGNDFAQLAGIVMLYETKGAEWRVDDENAEEIISKFKGYFNPE